mgnify:CR=1 FL=1
MFISIYLSNNIFGDFMIINDSKVKKRLIENGKEKHKIKNILQAFLFGGLIGAISQVLYMLYNETFKVNESNSSLLVSATIIFIAFLLTCIGIFDKIGLIGKAGLLIPISGFANSITSCALEGKTEGLIFGIGGKMFSLIGSVCTYGIVSSIILGFIYYFIKVIGWKVKA